ncbi:hypothetical protein Tco_0020586 [Tanacetum coccineum]
MLPRLYLHPLLVFALVVDCALDTKFYFKVVRESTTGDACEVKPIEIPPPRPKRNPMHCYPRKPSAPVKTTGHRGRSTSPNLSGSDQENQSPT